jgi:DNA polymerase I
LKQTIIVIDGNSVIHRAYHALPPLTKKDGKLVNAVYGFLLVFFKALNDFQPDFIAAAFDLPAPTFRHKKFKEYKAQRQKAPDDLYAQIPMVKEILRTFCVPVFEKEGFEADDIIATIVSKIRKNFSDILPIILSGDSDSLQLIDEKTRVYVLRKGVKDIILYDENAVKEKFQGLEPWQLLDFKALRGDSSDNVPGVLGVGDKTAINLLLKFGTLEKIYQEIKNKSQLAKTLKPKVLENLSKNKREAFFSKELVCLERNVPIDFDLDDSRWGNFDKEEIKKTLNDFEFYTLVKRVDNLGEEKKIIKEQGKLL